MPLAPRPEVVRGRFLRCTPHPRSVPRSVARFPTCGTAIPCRPSSRVSTASQNLPWVATRSCPSIATRQVALRLPAHSGQQHAPPRSPQKKRLRRAVGYFAPTSPQAASAGRTRIETAGDSRAGPSHPDSISHLSPRWRFRPMSSCLVAPVLARCLLAVDPKCHGPSLVISPAVVCLFVHDSIRLKGARHFRTEPRLTTVPCQNSFPLWRASHSRLEARQEENKANQQQSGRGGASDASPVTGLSWHWPCLGGEGAAAPLLSAAGVRASTASPWAAVAGAGTLCKASDRLRLVRPCRRW